MTDTTHDHSTPPDVPPDFEVPEHRIDREIYAMPAFTTLPVRDLESATRWYAAFGFEVLAEMGAGDHRLVHLRRYRYQDLLLVPAPPDAPPTAGSPSGARTSICHTGPREELDEMVATAAALGTGTVTGPTMMPWHALEVEAVDADGHRIALTARPATPPPPSLVEEVRNSLVD